jgi:putative ABC transport system permease protein
MTVGDWIVVLCYTSFGTTKGERTSMKSLRLNLSLLTEKFIREGMARKEASYAARRQFGGFTQVKQERYESQSLPLLETIFQDLRLAIRMFLKSPGFTATAVLALALGIGANTAIFSVVNAVLLKPLNYPDPDRIVQFMLSTPGGPAVGGSAAELNIWRQQTGVFDDVSAYRLGTIDLTGESDPEQLTVSQASATGFRLFGAPVVQGRTFTAEEDRPGGARVVVLSNALWQRRFAGDTHAVGKTISLGGEPYTVIGILGPGFDFDSDPPPDVFIPFQIDPNSDDQAHYFSVAGRLKPGVTLAMANAQLQFAYAQFRRKYPNYAGAGNGFSVERLQDRFVSDVRPALLVLWGAVSLVLLIACANVANLLLVRATGRKREIAIRAAVGAGRSRIVRQLLTESVVLSMAGGALGVGFGMAGVRALLAMNPGNIPRIGAHGSAVTADWRVATFTFIMSLATGVLFGLIPAVQASRGDLNAPLKESTSRSGTGSRQNQIRSILVISEMALALVLLIGSALLIRSFIALRAVNPGFDPHNVLTLRMSLTGTRFVNTAAVDGLIRDAVQRIDALPGVEVAGSSYALPLQVGSGLPFDIVSHPLAGGAVRVGYTQVSPGYFDVFKIPIVRGRAFTDRDDGAASGVALINQAMAGKFWPHADPLGDRIIIAKGYAPGFDEPARQIVGIAADIHDEGLNRAPVPMMYIPMAQIPPGITALATRVIPLAWAVRTRLEPHSLSSSIEKQLRQASDGLPVAEIRTMDEISVRSTARADFNMLLMSIFGGAALLLAAIGIYGLMSYSVRQRTQEIGIRLALGAQSGALRNMVVGQGMRLAVTGIAIGIAAAAGLTRFLAGFLFGVKAWDPVVFILVPVLLCAVALLAVWVPALRASRIDPIEALRCD